MSSPLFSAEPTHISGLGNLADELSTVMMQVGGLAKLGNIGGSVGLMQILDDPVNRYADITGTRLQSRTTVLTDTGFNLRRAAWIYSTTDQDWSKAIANADAHTRTPDTGAPPGASVTPDGSSPKKEVDEYPGAVAYPATDIPDLTAPAVGEADIRAVIDSTSGMLKDIDNGIREITAWAGVNGGRGWSPLEELVKPVSGNWSELERAGETFMKAGAGAEAVAANLVNAARTIDPYWNGEAAASYTDYSDKLARSLEWEGALGRIIQRVLNAVSEQIQETVKVLLDKLEQLIKRVVKSLLPYAEGPTDAGKAIAKKVPGVGWLWQSIEISIEFVNFYNEVKPILDSMEALLDDTKAFINALENPQDFAQQKLEDKLKPIQENIDKVESGIELGTDIVTVGQASRVTEAPNSTYNVGTGTQPWENER